MAATRNGTVLVVDDEPTIVEVLGTYLERAGFGVERAMDGLEALRLAELHRPDLVVLDLMLPGLDGFEVLRRLRERPGKPVAVISGSISDQSVLLYTSGPQRTNTLVVTKPPASIALNCRLSRKALDDRRLNDCW